MLEFLITVLATCFVSQLILFPEELFEVLTFNEGIVVGIIYWTEPISFLIAIIYLIRCVF